MKKDILYFEVINNDDVHNEKQILGTVRFPLESIERQEEYELELEIPDDNDENIIMAKINAKVHFIWSMYKYYQDMLTKSERVLNNCTAMLQKTNRLLENLNEPFKYLEYVGRSDAKVKNLLEEEIEKPHRLNYRSQHNPPSHSNQSATIGLENNNQYKYADQLENFIKTTFSKIF